MSQLGFNHEHDHISYGFPSADRIDGTAHNAAYRPFLDRSRPGNNFFGKIRIGNNPERMILRRNNDYRTDIAVGHDLCSFLDRDIRRTGDNRGYRFHLKRFILQKIVA